MIRKQISPVLRILAHEAEAEGFKGWAYEYQFYPLRKWRFDVCWPDLKVAFEREGFGIKGEAGRHQRAAGMSGDCRKYNAAQSLGWYVVRGTPNMMEDGSALADLLDVLRYRTLEYRKRFPQYRPAGRTKPELKEGRPLS